ncbi:MAG TPA: M17 family peptidase N-terminal domain-containing protein, partial [Dehalococcoidia bacterium]
MELKVASGDITQAQADTILVNLFEGVQQPSGATAAVDQALDGAISYLIQAGEVKGKAGEATVVHTFGKLPALRVVVVGLGKQEDLKADTVRKAAGNVARRVRALGARKVATVVHGAG